MWFNIHIGIDTPPHSSKDSNVSPKVKTMKEKKDGVCYLACSTSKIEGGVRTMGWGLGWMTRGSIIHKDMHKQTHNTHHDPDLGKLSFSPL
jgi:hypothetical protein